MTEHAIVRATLHHTAVALDDNADAPARARQHQRYHQDEGFADLAYHFMVDREGNVYEGRSTAFAGETFTEYDPSGHLLITAEGDLDQQDLPPAQLDAIVALLAWGMDEFDLDPAEIGGHSDFASTSCPGDSLRPLIDDGRITEMVEDRLAQSRTRLVLVCGDDAAARVAAIEAGE